MIFRWGHFADLHFEYGKKRGFKTSALRDKLTEELENHQLDAILIAGDLFHKGNTSDTSAKDISNFVQKMALSTGCQRGNIFICAGNHDLPRSPARANSLATIIKAYAQPEIPDTESGLDTTGYESIVHDAVCAPFQRTVNAIRGTSDTPLLHGFFSLEHANIIILNTAIFAGQTYPGQVGGPGKSVEDTALYIADSHLTQLLREVKEADIHRSNKLNIVLAHHGTGCFVRKEFHELATALDDMGVDLYLCGHVHQNHHEIITHTNYIPQISCGGLFEDGYNSPSFLIGEFDTETKAVRITAYEFNKTQSRWVPSASFPRPWKDSVLTFTPRRSEFSIPTPSSTRTMRELLKQQILDSYPDEKSSFAFTKLVKDFLASQKDNPSFAAQLLDILKTDTTMGPNHSASGFKGFNTGDLDFVAYYCLAYHYKQTERVSGKDSLQSLVDTYDGLFDKQLLSNEVKAWLARRTNRLDKAYEYDCRMIKSTTVNHNAAVFVSYASTICTLMDRESPGGAESFWASQDARAKDLELALSFMKEITDNYRETYQTNRGYPKHFYLWTKLLAYKALFVPMSDEERARTITDMGEIVTGYRNCSGPDDAD